MWFPTKERVTKQLTKLTADSLELERQAQVLSTRFSEADSLLGEFKELASFQQELRDTTEALMIAGEAVISGQVTPKRMAKNLPMFQQQISVYQQTMTGMLASVMAFGASQ